eukprot:9105963-Pyramimonas_sp.AAC.1
MCAECSFDDELDLVESDGDSDDDLDFEGEDQAQTAYLQYESSCAEWDKLILPQEIEDQYQVFLEHARRWNKFRKFGRRR